MDKQGDKQMPVRYKGRFITNKNLKWRKNVGLAAKNRKISLTSKEEPEPKKLKVEGRRVVDVKQIAEDSWCKFCNSPISLRNIEGESIVGLASVFSVRCVNYLSVSSVHTAKYVDVLQTDTKGKKLYDVNMKLAIGGIDGGIGTSKINTVLSALNIPTVNTGLMKRHERVVGAAIESLAEETCIQAISEEKECVLSKNQASNQRSEGVVCIEGSYDGAWQKRGNGHTYDSLSGHGSLIGVHTGKVLAFSTRIKHCRFCQMGRKPNDHECCANWTGSSEAMEADIAVEIISKNKNFENANVRLGTLIGDEDSSTIAAVRRESKQPVIKWSDLNHAKKTLSKALWAQKINRDVIEYLKHCFGCAIKKNKNDVEATATALSSIVPHAFDEHESCGEWCKFKADPMHYKHRGLPGGRGLTGETLRSTLNSIFKKFCDNAEKLAPCGSSQSNESFNALVATKNPKSCHYSGSQSLNIRVAASVCHKNVGTSYLLPLHTKLSLSPGKHTTKFRQMRDNTRTKRAADAKKIEFKRRRLDLRKLRTQKKVSNERKEGITYLTACGFDRTAEILIDGLRETCRNGSIVFFDLETTGLSIQHSEICQIGARYQDLDFSSYIVPAQAIPKKVSEITGLTVVDGELFLHEERVETSPPATALASFIAFLKNIGESIILVAHNGRRLDAPMIVRDMQSNGFFDQFSSIVSGFADTLPIFRKKLPERRANKLRFNQSALAADLLGIDTTAGAHNAVNDVRVLQQIADKIGLTPEDYVRDSTTVAVIVRDGQQNFVKKANRGTMDCLKTSVSSGMIGKLAETGINLKTLQQAFLKGNDEAVHFLLAEDVGGHPRITKNKKIILNIINETKESLHL